jgi:hypothetical protein
LGFRLNGLAPLYGEAGIILALAFCSIAGSVALAIASGREHVRRFAPPRLIGLLFVLGFVLIGVAISQWESR